MKLAMIRGSISAYLGDRIVIYNECSGIGFEVVTNNLKFDDDEPLVYIWHVITDRDQTLYGFKDQEQVELAKRISQAPGMGPALSSKLVQNVSIGELEYALQAGDAKKLAELCSGLGLKKAKAILSLDFPARSVPRAAAEAVKALETLGHSVSLDHKRYICKAACANPEATSAELVRAALAKKGEE